MQKIVIVANGAAYGSESLFNSLRLAIALREQESELDLRLFFNVRCGHRRAARPEACRGLQHPADAGDPHCAKRAGKAVQDLHRRPRH